MTRFTVVWKADALDDLADIWLKSGDRDRIVSVAESIDLELTVDPNWKSEELSEGLLALTLPPLRIIFAINDADRQVEVYQIKTLPTDRK
ncbi:MAG: hypothetical protein ACKV2Q_34655 [Planctomycetaceae bacterium]